MTFDFNAFMRQIPSMSDLLNLPWVPPMEELLGRSAVKSVFAEVIGEFREMIRTGKISSVDGESIVREARARLAQRSTLSLRRVLNGTGVVVHTNLGRSPLPLEVMRQVEEVAAGYSTLEFSLDEGVRGHRNQHVEWLLCQLTGADGAVVVNNNAAAVLLCLAGLASGREVIVSRGELVEIGGSFRIPEILSFAGAKMVEVGTTNRTHLSDYESAISDSTAVLLKVHPSNFRIEGFHCSVDRQQLAQLAVARGLTLVEDLGSGLLEPLDNGMLTSEPTVKECLSQGVDLVTFSGDKLLGGPQIGVIAGRRQLTDRLKRHPLMRAFRVDKMTLAAFEGILRMMLQGRGDQIPARAMLSERPEKIKKRAQKIAAACRRRIRERSIPGDARVIPVEDAVGGGAFPAVPLNGYGVALDLPSLGGASRVQRLFRKTVPPVVLGVDEGMPCLHVRTLLSGEEMLFMKALDHVLGVR
ncbi:seryl-tRNA(Sec) selenium transferase [Thermanaerovibrio velox DSM 12556]|uniref:L-seryl-tRNA(Sec) selenium transferase n=2 Tax=Thermanaerovibrio TaxID=81461 RepID=H0US63_9BACT|nr:seryl-tRNA(Sec) selenium transferase [Thermanaerovibrio velox DSM 12556]